MQCFIFEGAVFYRVVGRILAIVLTPLITSESVGAQRGKVSFPKVESANATGVSRTITTPSSFDTTNPFF
jgi:hypothetical protein